MQTELIHAIGALTNFIYEEKATEEAEYEQLHSEFSTSELVAMGFAIGNLQFVKAKTLFHKKTLVVFQYTASKASSGTMKLKTNDVVYLIKKNDNKDKKVPILRGTLYDLRGSQARFLVDEKEVPEEKLRQQGLCLIKALDNVTYQR